MSLDQTYARLLCEKESKRKSLVGEYSNYLENNIQFTKEEKESYYRNKDKKEKELTALNNQLEKFEECKRYSEETTPLNLLRYRENNRKVTRPKKRKIPKKIIKFKINDKEYETPHAIECIRELTIKVGRDKFLEIINHNNFKYKKCFTNRINHKTSKLELLGLSVSIPTKKIYDSIQEILPKTNLSMSISIDGENILNHIHS